jgi:hypothetical protein
VLCRRFARLRNEGGAVVMQQQVERPIPNPGIYDDVSFEEYLKWDCANNSRLTAAQQSAMHLREAFEGPALEATPPMKLGSLTHAGTLEPMALLGRYVVMPDFENQIVKPDGTAYASPKATKQYKQLCEEFCAANANKEVVTQDQYDAMRGMVTQIIAHERARDYLSPPGRAELSLVWDDPETGIRCKCRLDWADDKRGRFTDLKTTRCADVRKFQYAIENYGYDQQLAMYQHGYEVLTGNKLQPCLVVVENVRPYAVQAAPMNAVTLYRGDFYYRRALRMLAHGRDTGEWPGYDLIDEFAVREGAIPDGSMDDITIGGEAIFN